MKKKTSLSAKLIAAFMAAILGSVLICALLTHSKVESVLNSNMQLTSEQTLNSAMTSLQTYEKTISIPVDLLTRKDSIKQLLLEPVQIPLHRITDSASNGSVFPVVTEHFSASSDHAFL